AQRAILVRPRAPAASATISVVLATFVLADDASLRCGLAKQAAGPRSSCAAGSTRHGGRLRWRRHGGGRSVRRAGGRLVRSTRARAIARVASTGGVDRV